MCAIYLPKRYSVINVCITFAAECPAFAAECLAFAAECLIISHSLSNVLHSLPNVLQYRIIFNFIMHQYSYINNIFTY